MRTSIAVTKEQLEMLQQLHRKAMAVRVPFDVAVSMVMAGEGLLAGNFVGFGPDCILIEVPDGKADQ